jgi:hypothetical protein
MIHPVKKFLFILMLLILPLQLSWAAMAPYCQHEDGAAGQHLGHHAHHHVENKIDDGADSGGGSPVKAHADCVTCHGGAVGIAITPMKAAPDASVIAAGVPAVPLPAFLLPERPERPKWTLAA